jgi:hypothetical protein
MMTPGTALVEIAGGGLLMQALNYHCPTAFTYSQNGGDILAA